MTGTRLFSYDEGYMNNSVVIDGQARTIQDDGMVRFHTDQQMNVLFYKKAVIDPIESRERGRTWTRAVDYVKIQQPGERDYVDRPARDDDKARWPQLWARYEQGQKQAPQGTPIDILFPQNPEIPANLHTLGVHTIEQCAGLTEHGAQTIGIGATMWRNKAKEFLSCANGGAGYGRLKAENDKLQNVIEVQGNQLAQMKHQLDQLAAQVNQKISPNMIPPHVPTIAQETFAARQAQTFSNDYEDADPSADVNEDTPANEIQSGGEPLFVETSDDSHLSDAPAASPKRGPGRPPKPR
jgi:hypothetical protein